MKKCIVVELPTGLCRMELTEDKKYVPVLARDIGLLEKYVGNQLKDVNIKASDKYDGWVYINPYYGVREGEYKVYIQYDVWPDGAK